MKKGVLCEKIKVEDKGFGALVSHYDSGRPAAQVLACSNLYVFAPFESLLEKIKVEDKGFEPLTPRLPAWCSPS